MITRAALALILSSASPALAEDVQLAFPLDCTLGQDCHIQQYMDQDPSAAANFSVEGGASSARRRFAWHRDEHGHQGILFVVIAKF